MLFDYTASTSQPSQTGAFWSRFPLQPLAPGILTPFSYSVLAELVGRAWFAYYDRLGLEPTPRPKLVRQVKGHVYFNLSLGAKIESEQAGVEPLPLRVNGQSFALAAWEKPGFLAGFKLGRAQKRMEDAWIDAARQMGETTEKARAWYQKTQSIRRWGQAEVLQIMEEIERIGIDSMIAFLAARLNLGRLYARLVADLAQGNVSTARAALLINNALGISSNISGGLVESSIFDALIPIANSARDPQQIEWLKQATAADWHRFAKDEQVASDGVREAVKLFMDSYGHRALQEGEMANPRWVEDASLLRLAILSQIEQPITRQTAANQRQPLLDALPASARKQGEQNLKQIGELLQLQSQALHAFAYVLGGTRTWALSSAREAMVDKRLHAPTEAFLLELEEIKQLMTGEWNISSLDEIRALVAKRQEEHDALRNEVAPDALVGDEAVVSASPALPGVIGNATGPLTIGTNLNEQGAVVAATHLDSGYTLALPSAVGFVGMAGTPFDPFVVAAQQWQRPVTVNVESGSIGDKVTELGANSTPVTLEVGADGVVLGKA